MFYTSKDDNSEEYSDLTPLNSIIHDCITNLNNMVFYLIGPKFKSNEYCMFEGGAGWATRSIGDYPILSIKYEYIPKFLTNGKREPVLYKDSSISLNRETYLTLVQLLNSLIDHINSGRKIKSEPEVPSISEISLPKDIDLKRCKKDITEYMNKNILEFWDLYIKEKIEEYVEEIQKHDNA